MIRKLGRPHKSKTDKRTIQFSSIVVDDLPGFPFSLARDEDVPHVTHTYDNETVGDCTVAAPAYLVETWTGYGKFGQLIDVKDVLKFYSEVSGWDSKDPSTDVGADMITVLRKWREDGIGKDKLYAFAEVDYKNIDHVKSAINLCGGVYVGAQLPLSARTAVDAGKRWIGSLSKTGDDTPGSWGGHAMSASRYDRSTIGFRTWGKLQIADWLWWVNNVDECWAPMSLDWIHGDAAPNGLNIAKLRAYLDLIAASKRAASVVTHNVEITAKDPDSFITEVQGVLRDVGDTVRHFSNPFSPRSPYEEPRPDKKVRGE